MAKAVDFVKNHRVFRAIVQTNALGKLGPFINIESPFTCEFNIERGSYNSMNHMLIKFYNLKESTRNSLYWDETNFDSRPKIEFQAGYGQPGTNTLPWDLSATKLISCFRGLIWRCYSVRQGTDFITTIECRDGADAFNSAQLTAVFPNGTPKTLAIKQAVDSMAPFGVRRGVISKSYKGTLARGNTAGQKSLDFLKEQTSNGVFIDNGVCHCLPTNEYIAGGIPVISSASGLLNTPQREGNMLEIEMLFEPRILVFQQVILNTTTGPDIFNGKYKVMAVKHQGMISETVGGSATTSVSLFFGTFFLRLAEDAS